MTDEEPALSDVAVRAYSITSYGSASERDFHKEFWSPAGESLEAEGFEFVGDVGGSLHLPPTLLSSKRRLEPTAVFGADDAIVAISLFIAAAVGQWAIGKICDWLWERKFREPLTEMLERRRREGYADKPMTVSFGVWYDTDAVYIGAVASLGANEGDDHLADLIPEAQRRGLAWVEAHGITKPVVIFPIRNGELASVPTLSDSISD
ncbi:MAG TPA: hypothetical protein VII45_03030 [Solirubrobacterales bacterium]